MKYLSLAQASDLLGVSERTIRRRIADGTLRAR
ncbi:helix-turn-helix domain-containing protein, partial [Mycobacterium kansasii]